MTKLYLIRILVKLHEIDHQMKERNKVILAYVSRNRHVNIITQNVNLFIRGYENTSNKDEAPKMRLVEIDEPH